MWIIVLYKYASMHILESKWIVTYTVYMACLQVATMTTGLPLQTASYFMIVLSYI